jgi:UDP-N-acetyl-D-glucosamine dehydrogenase
MRVTVIGQGYVGLTLSIAAARAGHIVTGYDINPDLVESLLVGITDVPGISSREISSLVSLKCFIPTTDPNLIKNSEIVVICVPTPLSNTKLPDLNALQLAVETIGKYLNNNALIINESTSYPGTLRDFIKPVLESMSKLDFEYVSAPERVDPANSNWGIKNTPRLISGITKSGSEKAMEFYSSFCDKVFHVSKPEVAETSKLFENTFRQVNISLVNELSIITQKLGISSNEVISAASTKPFGFMPFYPGIGVGGHCIPVDPIYLGFKAKSIGLRADFIDLASEINDRMPLYIADRMKQEMGGELRNKRVQIAGITYKSNVSDLRESPALILIAELEKLGAEVIWFDPLVGEFNGKKSVPLDPEVDLGLIISPHDKIDFSIWRNQGTKVIDLSSDNKNYGWPKYL